MRFLSLEKFSDRMSTCKLIQRRCYDLLSHKYSLLIIVIAFTCVFIGVIHFGEVKDIFYCIIICFCYLFISIIQTLLLENVFPVPFWGQTLKYLAKYFLPELNISPIYFDLLVLFMFACIWLTYTTVKLAEKKLFAGTN